MSHNKWHGNDRRSWAQKLKHLTQFSVSQCFLEVASKLRLDGKIGVSQEKPCIPLA